MEQAAARGAAVEQAARAVAPAVMAAAEAEKVAVAAVKKVAMTAMAVELAGIESGKTPFPYQKSSRLRVKCLQY